MVKLYFAFAVIVLGALQAIYSKNLSTSIIAEVLRQSREDNVVFSPNLVIEGLWQLYLGAEGNTADQIGKLINSPLVTKNAAIAEYLNWKKSIATLPPQGVTLNKGNKIYVADDLNLLPSYQHQTVDIVNSTVERINFGDSENAVLQINNWVAQQTNNKITELVKGTDGDTKVTLLSAIYFQGEWKHKFDVNNTSKERFYIPQATGDLSVIYVDTMSQRNNFRYNFIEKLDADSLELPYANSSISMIILLPREKNGIDKVVKNLDKVHIDEIAPKSNERDIEISLPRFKFEMEKDLKDVLNSLGIEDLFFDANLKAMTDFTARLKVSQLLQKAIIEVGENGTTAVAAQVTQIVTVSGKEPLPGLQYVYVDHPYVFVIKDNDKVYFAGRASNLE